MRREQFRRVCKDTVVAEKECRRLWWANASVPVKLKYGDSAADARVSFSAENPDTVATFLKWAEQGGEVDTECVHFTNYPCNEVDDDFDTWTHAMAPVYPLFSRVFKNLKHLVYSSATGWPGSDWLKPLTNLRTLVIMGDLAGQMDIGWVRGVRGCAGRAANVRTIFTYRYPRTPWPAQGSSRMHPLDRGHRDDGRRGSRGR